MLLDDCGCAEFVRVRYRRTQHRWQYIDTTAHAQHIRVLFHHFLDGSSLHENLNIT